MVEISVSRSIELMDQCFWSRLVLVEEIGHSHCDKEGNLSVRV